MSTSFLEILTNASRWEWRWKDMCGPDGLQLWSPKQHDLGLCFQKLCLQIPVLFLFTISSAYYYGLRTAFVQRGRREMCMIQIRYLVSFCMVLMPIIKLCIKLFYLNFNFTPINYLLLGTQCIAWCLHFLFLNKLTCNLGRSPRGPLLIGIFWSIILVLSISSFRSHLIIYNTTAYSFYIHVSLGCALAEMILQLVYALTLIPGGGPIVDMRFSTYGSQYEQVGERSPLLGGNNAHMYSSFPAERDPEYLGVAMDGTPFLSRLLFCWVNPLMQKGSHGKLTDPDALYDLPLELTASVLSQKLDKALIGNVDRYQIHTSSTTGSYDSGDPSSSSTSMNAVAAEAGSYRRHNVSLLRALHSCFGFQFYAIGVLKLVADCAGFAGPLLLNKLVSFIENKSVNIGLGYSYALGLCLTTLLAAFCNTHFNFRMAMVGLKIRAALVTAIYRKTLTARPTALNSKFGVGEIVNFMSTDTDRIVNSCPSFHAFWSIPFQLAVTLYLLYDQVGLAFLAGLAFSVTLIPINKCIANKIGELSTKMMNRKDARVKLMAELLRGIRTVKLHAWEHHFMRTITKLRDDELLYLKGRKYLDALCVYFWATTPVLISILTFTTYVLLGNKLTAATVFTSIALLNMLIGPLNAFPWVLNGVTEAWVSVKRIQALLDIAELDVDLYYDQGSLEESDVCIKIHQAAFNWGNVSQAKPIGPELTTSRRRSRLVKRVRRQSTHIQQKQTADAESSSSTETVPETKHVPFRDDGDLYSRSIGRTVNKLLNRGSRLFAHIQQEQTAFVESSSSTESFPETKHVPYREKGDFYLHSISLIVNKGAFVGIMGPVGSGKSTLLSSILAEVDKRSGSIAVADVQSGFSYVAQQPWLQHGTIRENIVFGKVYDEARYTKVVWACCLQEDLQLLPNGDLTGVGDSGNTLSGGQRARVALARAVYQNKPIYIMDDILSAVDVKVANHIFTHCIMGLLKHKTRILSTHLTRYLLYTDHLVSMSNGTISQQDKPSDVQQDLADELLLVMDGDVYDTLGSIGSAHSSTVSVNAIPAEHHDTDSILQQETKETGTVEFQVYSTYWRAIGSVLAIAILFSMFMMQTSRNMTDLWLSYWVSHSEPPPPNSTSKLSVVLLEIHNENDTEFSVTTYLTYYGIFAGLNSVFTLIRAFLFAFGGIQAASRVHRDLLRSIIWAKITFFDVSPLGRILNRFSSDTYTVDDSLPFILNILLAQLFAVIGTLVVTVYGLPWLLLILVPLIPIYHSLQSHYRLTSRELKRLTSVTLSPVYSHFNESIQGLSTIRAFRASQRFKRDNEDHVEANQKAQFASQAAGQWLGLRLQFIGVTMITGVGIIAVVQHQVDAVDPGLVGLAISYALSITGLLGGVVNAFTETEREMIAVERVNQYIVDVEHEKVLPTVDWVNPPYAWPGQGVIIFEDVVLIYREHLMPALRGISFSTRPAEKIGVVGRTGAGKSSLLMALFRMVELCSGTIQIDTVNISQISLQALRSRLSIIPQEPFLFSGTVRENLDPLREFRSSELWNALQRCDLTGVVKRLGGLEASFSVAGQNLSVGQRQLLCLARAVLHKAKILCIDEATANVDFQTDLLIQKTIRSSFQKSTVITIAHRVQTIMDCDRVLVMGDGEILEFDEPEILLSNPQSHFSQLVHMDKQ